MTSQLSLIVIFGNFCTICPKDMYLIFLEMEAHFPKLGWDTSQVSHVVPPPLTSAGHPISYWSESFGRNLS